MALSVLQITTTTKSRLTMGIGVLCTACFIFLLLQMTVQFLNPPISARLLMRRDIALPSAFPDAQRTSQHPFAPGLATLFDHFDFQAIDSQTHLLFIAHSGPNPDREKLINPHFDPSTDAKNDGNVIVFNTQQQKIVALLNIPQVAGVIVAPDLHKVFVADANDNIIYDIDETTFKTKQIPLQDNDSPDDLWYDQEDHIILISDPGTPANPDKTNAIERKNQNETLINALNDTVVGRVILGIDGKWADDIGHVRFDPELHRIFVVTQQLADPDSLDPNLLPPAGTSALVTIDPLTHQVVTRLRLPDFCITPHGLAVDTRSHIAFIACVDASPTSLLRVDVQKMAIIHEAPWPVEIQPDMLQFDSSLHLLYVASGAGITIFKENGFEFRWLGSYTFGINTHSLIVNEETHEVYIPLPRVGGRPVLRIMQYYVAQYP